MRGWVDGGAVWIAVRRWGAFLAFSALAGLILLRAGRRVRNFGADTDWDPEFALFIAGVFELIVFSIEKSTAMVVFTQVNDLYDPSVWWYEANIVTTLMSAVLILFLWAAISVVRTREVGVDLMFGVFGVALPCASIIWTIFVASHFVARKAPISDSLHALILTFYGFTYTSGALFGLYYGGQTLVWMAAPVLEDDHVPPADEHYDWDSLDADEEDVFHDTHGSEGVITTPASDTVVAPLPLGATRSDSYPTTRVYGGNSVTLI
jgi:hypothetical protein